MTIGRDVLISLAFYLFFTVLKFKRKNTSDVGGGEVKGGPLKMTRMYAAFYNMESVRNDHMQRPKSQRPVD